MSEGSWRPFSSGPTREEASASVEEIARDIVANSAAAERERCIRKLRDMAVRWPKAPFGGIVGQIVKELKQGDS